MLALNLLIFIVLYFSILNYLEIKDMEKYDPNMYDYDRENPNALITGRVIGGTVYSSNEEDVPGLGWII